MEIKEEYENHTEVHCGYHLIIDSIQQQKAVLIKALELKHPIVLIANDVTRVDTASLQLVLSFVIAAKAQNVQFSWEKPSQPLIQVSKLLGLNTLLQLPEA